MELPPELRNKIYEECLTDDKALYITSKDKLFRRVATRDMTWRGMNRIYSHERQQLKTKTLVTNILAVSKTIYAEAAPILYSQSIIVRDNRTLLDFVAGINPRCATLLRDITITSWCSSNSHKSVNLPAMALLAARGATNLTRLSLDCNLGYYVTWSHQPRGKTTPITKRVARKIFRDCYHWLIAVGEAKGDPYAALDVLKVRQSNFSEYARGHHGEMHRTNLMMSAEEEMKQHLRKLLDRI
jgi:hypothetical protein